MSDDVTFQMAVTGHGGGQTAGTVVRYVSPSLPDRWWSAAHLARVPEPLAPAADGTVEVLLVADLSPVEAGPDEVSLRVAEAQWWQRRHETVRVPVAQVLRVAGQRDYESWRTERDRHRVAAGLARVVPRGDGYALRHPWPVGTFVQGGTTHQRVPATAEHEADPDLYVYAGHVLIENGRFLEAFPRDPATFLRGEGADFAAAEAALWVKWQRIVGCESPTGAHEYETCGYRNGAGICRHCGLFSSKVFDLAEIGSVCSVCGVGTYWTTDAAGNLFCEEHTPQARCRGGVEHSGRYEALRCTTH